MLKLIAAALADEPLGAPSEGSQTDYTSTGNNGQNAAVSLKSNGARAIYFNGVAIDVDYWLTPQTNMEEYEVRATLLSGDTPIGTFDTWTALSSTQTWRIRTLVDDETLTASVFLEIRWTGNNVVQSSATYTLIANGP